MTSSHKKILKVMLFLLPLVLGTVGLMNAGMSLVNAIFDAITMYGMNYGEEPANWMVQLARWLAPIATVSGIALMFASFARAAYAWIGYLGGNSVAVYGDDRLAESIRKECKCPVVPGKDKLLQAHRYVLFWDEATNLEFYLEHQKELANKQVYLRCSAIDSQISEGSNLHLFSAEETGARLFWKQAQMFSTISEMNPELSIVFIGFGKLGEQLLLWGLQNNIFYPNQKITYHIFGDADHFLSLHRDLTNITDSIIWHQELWNHNIETLLSADRIIVCKQERQIETIQDLLFAIPEKNYDILAEHPEIPNLLEGKNRLKVFCWRDEAQKPKNIFDDRTLERAKAINLRYAHIYRAVEENPKNMEREWELLDSFTRYSNISAADYHEIRLQMLQHWGEKELNSGKLELLSELEHIRWSRFHYLNNWQYGIPDKGAQKDAEKRIHRDLVPYAELSEVAKEKDRENIRVLLQME